MTGQTKSADGNAIVRSYTLCGIHTLLSVSDPFGTTLFCVLGGGNHYEESVYDPQSLALLILLVS